MYGIIDHSITQRMSMFTSSGLINIRTIILFLVDLAVKTITMTLDTCRSVYQTLVPPREKPIRGQIVFITGTGSGIGRELAMQFAVQGCIVICVDADSTSNDTTAHEINRLVKNESNTKKLAYAYTCDVKDQYHVFRLATEIEEELGRVDILINNTIVTSGNQLERLQTSVVQNIKENMMMHFWTVLAFLPGMICRKQGHIVSITTATSLADITETVQYSSSQYAVRELMDSLFDELHLKENKCIALTCVQPFVIDTRSAAGDISELRLPELSIEFAATEIIKGIRLNLEEFTIPRNILVWINVLRRFQPESWNTHRYRSGRPNRTASLASTICGISPELSQHPVTYN